MIELVFDNRIAVCWVVVQECRCLIGFPLTTYNDTTEAEMQSNNNRRKRRRKPTLTPRFGPSSVALEIGLLRMALEVQREQEKKQPKRESK